MTADAATEFETERFYPVDAATLWSALTDPEKLSKWIGGDVVLDGPVDAGVEGTMTTPDGARVPLIVEHVEQERRIGFRWASDADAPSQVWFEIDTELGAGVGTESAGVRLRVIERIVPFGVAVMGGGATLALAR